MSFILLLLYLIASYVRPGEILPALAPYRPMMAIGVMTSIATGFALLFGQRPTFRARQPYLMAALLAAVSFSLVAQGWIGGAVYAVEEFGVTAAMFFLIIFNTTSWHRLKSLVAVLVVLTCFLSVQSAIAYHYGYNEELLVLKQNVEPSESLRNGDLSEEKATLRRTRSLGVLHDPNDLAQALLIALPFLALAWVPGHALRNLAVVVVPGTILLYGVFLTRSRGGLVALLALASLAFRARLGRVLTILMTSAMGIGLVAMNATGGRGLSIADGSAQGRLEAWAEGIEMLKSSPLFGVGYRNFIDYNERAAHSSFINCFSEIGLIGYFLWLALIVVTIIELRSMRRATAVDANCASFARWAGSIEAALYAFLVAGMFLSRTYSFLLYLLIAIAVSLADLARRSEITVPVISPPRWMCSVAAVEAASVVIVYVVVKIT